MYPEIEPYDQGLLDVGDGNRVYWEVCGNPYGKPVVFLHGGPGGGCKPVHRRLFDPAVYRIVLLDQRGCGRSIPHAAEPDADLSANTTWHLVADLEKVREHLGVDRWQVSGGSWGSTLALAYAEMYPERVTELVLRGVFTLRRKELDWFYRGGAGMLFPEMWERLTALVPEGEDVIEAYGRLLNDPDPVVRETAAVTWSVWEASTVALVERPELVADFGQPRFALAFARIENHYFRHAGWLEEGQLLRDAGKLAGIPGVIVQGRYDMATPATSAWELHRAWPGSELVMVPDAGHAFDEPGVLRALLAATDRFRA
ncbi:proline iminopeptidase [Saccharothrix ecbatanensis]|uniref:Proline iminopeptidase n=1 Tax=Saccharothrix ecbatanensis TaxID=1105145 RepID=A0A7W9M562_9PSEU|nr:prolyl aminopeptidase [Saccharothrix ecbatanensis]MBB5807851.1 proline iminopeptidase [Saccharothrix ecbatanensis]